MVQKLFNVEKLHMRHFLHCSYSADGIFQQSITFEPLNHILKTQLFWNVPTCGQQVLIFNYLNI